MSFKLKKQKTPVPDYNCWDKSKNFSCGATRLDDRITLPSTLRILSYADFGYEVSFSVAPTAV